MQRWVSLAALAFLGCQVVTEDRTITWSESGDAVGFQHGDEGVFVAGKDGGGLERVYKPGQDVLATSTPLWSPDASRLIFTSAFDPAGKKRERGGGAAWAAHPDGRPHGMKPVRYVCHLWRRGEGELDEEGDRAVLFEAACDHVGYVAANLAVRWHPDGDRVLFIDRVEETRHGLFEHVMATGERRRVFPESADILLHDSSPNGEWLVVVAGFRTAGATAGGIWMTRRDADDWQRVPGSEGLVERTGGSIEVLRQLLPAWSSDGARFALAAPVLGGKNDRTITGLHIGAPGTSRLDVILESEKPLRDLRWSPDGRHVGFVQGALGDEEAALWIGGVGLEAKEVSDRPVRRFAGWDATGDNVAYVSPGAPRVDEANHWAFLLVRDPLARDAVLLAPGDGSAPGREVFRGPRVTFPRWSPTDAKLSLWVTFQPLWSSWLSRLLRWELRPGDPAAILDLPKETISWLTVNDDEKVQVGHYHMLRREWAEAWRWYERAESGMEIEIVESDVEKGEPVDDIFELLERLRGPRDPGFFHFLCLRELGRHDEAARRYESFVANFLPPPGSVSPSGEGQPSRRRDQLQQILSPDSFGANLLRRLYEAEVMLSLDLVAEAEQFFGAELAAETSVAGRASCSIALAQVLLVRGEHAAYANLATEDLLADFLELLGPPAAEPRGFDLDDDLPSAMLVIAGGLTMLPLASTAFIETLDARQVERVAGRVAQSRGQLPAVAALLVDSILACAHGKLEIEGERVAAQQRALGNPEAKEFLEGGDVEGFIRQVREMLLAFRAGVIRF